MLAIYKRELKSYFQSFIGFLFIAVTLFFVSLYYIVYNLMSGYPYFSYAIANVVILFLIAIPVLCMRVLSEERKNKTDQLILTAPISVGDIVMGKFLALLTVFAIPSAIICLYPLSMSLFGSVPMGQNYIAILGFFLYGMASIATCVFISSLTESVVIAAVLSFIAMFVGYMMSGITSMISATGNWFTKILGCYDTYTPFSELLNGTLNLKSVAYYFLLTALLLFLTVQSIQKRRYSVSVKNFSFSAYSTISVALAAAAVIVVNLVIDEMPVSWTNIDMTSEKIYSLTDQTKEYVKGMQEDAVIYVIAAEDSCDTVVAQTLERMDELSDHLTVEYVDPSVNPRFYQQYTDSISMNSLIVVSEKRNKVVLYSSVYESDSSYDYYSGSYSSTTTGYDGEGQILSALAYVLSDDMPKLYLTQGHGEYDFSTTFLNGFQKENIEYETVNLMDLEEIPDNAAGVVVNGATTDFSKDDTEKILNYLKNGGKVILVTGLTDEETPNLDSIMDYMGLSVADGIVLEGDTSNYYRIPYYLLPERGFSTYTSGISSYGYLFAPLSKGILIQNTDDENMTYTDILHTSDKAFSKVGTLSNNDFSMSDEDIAGPFKIAVEARKDLGEDKEARLIAISCDQIFTDEANTAVSGNNQQLLSNMVSSFSDHEITVSVPVKSMEVSNLTVPQAKVILLGVCSMVIAPVALLLMGLIIWLRRRKR